ncbi:MAG: MBL fold metallo-hydrolase, partial [Spirochaetes bacterium]|nr:MBL fold metallo-hydrolase [Spirochaetota bacterium]
GATAAAAPPTPRMAFDLTFLGTGTSGGIPEISCHCPVCESTDPRDKRLRTSGLLSQGGHHLLIDSSTDLRAQFLREGIDDLDGVCYTHLHADHLLGLDDLRRITRANKKVLPLRLHPSHLPTLKRTFYYLFEERKQDGGGVVQVSLEPFEWYEAFPWRGLSIEPLLVRHGILDISAFLVDGRLAWITDASEIPAQTLERLRGVEVLVLNALRFRPHPTHFSLEQALAIAERVGARKTYFVHMCHDLGHGDVSKTLPGGVFLAFDGLRLSL